MRKGVPSGHLLFTDEVEAEVQRVAGGGKGLLDEGPGSGRGPSRASSIASSVTRAPGEPEDCQMIDQEDSHLDMTGLEDAGADADGDGMVSDSTQPEPTLVSVHVGLSGHVVSLPVEVDCDLGALQAKLCLALGRRVFARFMAGDEVLDSMEQFLDAFRCGSDICALLFKDVADMTLDEVVSELTLQEAELRGHLFTLSRLQPGSTAQDVANYLWENQVLLSATHAHRLFESLLPRLTRQGQRLTLRGELILVLHSFCSEPCAVWEPNDGHDECLWANMTWGHDADRNNPYQSSLMYAPRGDAVQFPHLPDASSSSQAKSPADVSNLRSVLHARRLNHAKPLASMSALNAYGVCWRRLA